MFLLRHEIVILTNFCRLLPAPTVTRPMIKGHGCLEAEVSKSAIGSGHTQAYPLCMAYANS
jgi:hypothetical protein